MRISLNYHKYSSSQHIDYTKTYLYAQTWIPHHNALQQLACLPCEFCECYVPRFAASFQLKRPWAAPRPLADCWVESEQECNQRKATSEKNAHTQVQHTVKQGSWVSEWVSEWVSVCVCACVCVWWCVACVCVLVWGLGLDSCSAITAHPAWAPSVQHLRVAVIPDREGY